MADTQATELDTAINERLRRIKDHVGKLEEALTGAPALDSSLDTIDTKDSSHESQRDELDQLATLANSRPVPPPEQGPTMIDTRDDDLLGILANLEKAKDILMESGEWEEGEMRTVGEDFKNMVLSAYKGAQEMEGMVEQLKKEVKDLKEDLKNGQRAGEDASAE